MIRPSRRPLYVTGHGLVLGRRGGRLVASRDGVVVTSAPLGRISEVVLFGNVTVTTPAMTALLAEDVPLALLTADGRPRGRLEPPRASHIVARRRQLELHHDDKARLRLAQAFVRGKIHNQDILLRRRAAGTPADEDAWALARRVAAAGPAAAATRSVAELNGVEGAASGAYFRALRLLLADGLGFRRRERHAPDVVNMLINYTSALLREIVFGAVVAAGLDPYVSFLHVPHPGRPTLVFDLMEEWRPVLLESTVLSVLGLRMVGPADVIAPEPPAARTAAPPGGRTAGPTAGRSAAPHPRDGIPGDVTGSTPPDAWASPGAAQADGSAGDGRGAVASRHDGGAEYPPLAPRPRLRPEATAAVIERFRARVDSPARTWGPATGVTYGSQIRAQCLALRQTLLDGVPYEPFRWR
ncbi:CRISPR-associated endonuclease Cas1 [Pseudofrankia sp. BMG5.37]|uniref:CRISPR-associated endonuclease Cas1 n=1 Tax=Pseudofrankia sp. BMG5.37 TaxID=3050035 RepID=UPI0028957F60|nr:CRISPR-associated endonuclease Cas1 [Pseudofrankia sp. BMG5.37]MDT3440465.1 CRISPR-associated endonuclease Cas1 [Pseudofrankia sp. BMG5.37]